MAAKFGKTRFGVHATGVVTAAVMLFAAGGAEAGVTQIPFNIPSTALHEALRAFSAQSGQHILFSEGAVRHVRTPAVNAVLPPEQALRLLLSNSGLEAYRGRNNVWIVRPAAFGAAPVRLITTALQAPQASFAPSPAANQAPSEEIVVTAQRRQQSLQDVPLSVAVVSGTALEERNVRTLEDLSNQQPAIRIAQGPASDQLHIRGIGSGFNPSFEQSVATFVDGVYRNRSRSSRVALFDIDRVEILKGPQTTFFGANAIAGALNITTRRAADRVEANASALYAPADGEYNVEAGLNLPLAEGLGLRVAGRLSGMDGYIRNERYGNDGPNLDDKQFRAALHLESGKLTVDARLDIARLRDNGTFNAELIGCPPTTLPVAGLCARALALNGGVIDDELNRRTMAGAPTYSNLDLNEGAITARIDLGAASLVSTTSYLEQKAAQLVDLLPFPNLSPLGTQAYQPLTTRESFDQFSQELRLESRGGEQLDYLLGAYYEKGDLDNASFAGLYFAPFGAALPAFFTPQSLLATAPEFHQKSETLSGFGSLTYKATDKLKLTASLRYTRVEKKASRSLVYGTGGAIPDVDNFVPAPAQAQPILAQIIGQSPNDYARGRKVDDAFMPAANISYDWSDDVLTYASYTRGFKAGGFSGTTPDLFDPEYVDAWEVGLKASWLDRRLVTNVAVYRGDYRDMQESQNTITGGGVAVTTITNAARSRSQGVEFSGTFRASDVLRLRADISYLDSQYRSYPNAPCSPLLSGGNLACFTDASGQRRAFAPRWSGSIGFDVRQPLSDALDLGVGTTLAFTSGFYQQSTISDLVRQPGYAKLDMRVAIGAPDRRWEAAIIARNLTDKQTASFRNYTPAAAGTVTALADRPRSVAFQISGRW